MTEITAAEIAETQRIVQRLQTLIQGNDITGVHKSAMERLVPVDGLTAASTQEFGDLVAELQTLHQGRTGEQLREHAAKLRELPDPVGEASWSGSEISRQAEAFDKAAAVLDAADRSNS